MIVAGVILGLQLVGLAWVWGHTAPPAVRPGLTPEQLAIRQQRAALDLALQYGPMLEAVGVVFADFLDGFEPLVGAAGEGFVTLADPILKVLADIGKATRKDNQ